MPGQHLTLTLWQCFDDVGGCGAWLSNWWDVPSENYSWLWWTGWHSPNPLRMWFWPGRWTLIGHERWDDQGGNSWLSQAFYANPNPSTTPWGRALTPVGHWELTYDQWGRRIGRSYSREILTEGDLYLKGSGSKGKGKGQSLSVCNHMIGMRL